MAKGRRRQGGPEKLRHTVSMRLRTAKELSGLRMTDVYNAVDAQSRTIHGHFNGECLPSGAHMVQYAKLFMLPTDYFYGLDSSKHTEVITLVRELLTSNDTTRKEEIKDRLRKLLNIDREK